MINNGYIIVNITSIQFASVGRGIVCAVGISSTFPQNSHSPAWRPAPPRIGFLAWLWPVAPVVKSIPNGSLLPAIS